MVVIRQAVSAADIDATRELFRAYLAGLAHDHGIDLGYQNVEGELSDLPGAYAEPLGAILLAEVEGRVAGVVALRPMEAGACELKRMYVRPEARGQGIGRALGEAIIASAVGRGYRLMRLDTADTLTAAQALYRSLGFAPCPPYYDPPPNLAARVVFMARPLAPRNL